MAAFSGLPTSRARHRCSACSSNASETSRGSGFIERPRLRRGGDAHQIRREQLTEQSENIGLARRPVDLELLNQLIAQRTTRGGRFDQRPHARANVVQLEILAVADV